MKWYEAVYWAAQVILTAIIWYSVWLIDVAPLWIFLSLFGSWYVSLNLTGVWKEYAEKKYQPPAEKKMKR